MNPTPQHKDTTLDEILADFSDGIAAEQAWVDARQALLQWRDKAVVEALENLSKSFINNKDYKGYMVKQVIEARHGKSN